ncbi:MAG: carboxymuconolactone decarboxylase family protein [Acidimicrobiia bacterium]
MHARMGNPAMVVPNAMPALQNLAKALGSSAKESGVPTLTLDLVYLRASQINSCSVCVDMHARDAKKAGATDEQLFSVAAWRETPYFTDAERAALALAEATTRLSDRVDAVADDVWAEAAKHYDEAALATLVMAVATVNLFNRLNAATRQVAGAWAG